MKKENAGLTQCSYCAEWIQPKAKVCRYCGKPKTKGEPITFVGKVGKGILVVVLLIAALNLLPNILMVVSALMGNEVEYSDPSTDRLKRNVDEAERSVEEFKELLKEE